MVRRRDDVAEVQRRIDQSKAAKFGGSSYKDPGGFGHVYKGYTSDGQSMVGFGPTPDEARRNFERMVAEYQAKKLALETYKQSVQTAQQNTTGGLSSTSTWTPPPTPTSPRMMLPSGRMARDDGRYSEQEILRERMAMGDPRVEYDSANYKFIEAKPKPEIETRIAHKEGHFPVDWMIEASERAQQSEVLVSIQLEKDGVVVIGQSGDDYETVVLSWKMMQQAHTNPVLVGIETVEKHLDTLANLKRRVKAVAK